MRLRYAYVCLCALSHGLVVCHRLKHGSMPHIGLTSSEDTVTIKRWTGRIGNNLEQLAHAIVYAESIGARHVVLPHVGKRRGGLGKLFALPRSFSIYPNTKLQGVANCYETRVRKNPFFFMHCASVQRSDYKSALTRYVKPFLRPDTKAACAREGQGFDGLTIHLRGGDLTNKDHPQARFPPCSLYIKVLQENRFATLRVVAEPGKKSPCIDILIRDSGVPVQVQNGPVVEAACALMSAQHLVYGLSTFAETMALLNTNLRSVAVPMLAVSQRHDVDFGSEEDSFGPLGSCIAPDKQMGSDTAWEESAGEMGIEYSLYEIPGIAQMRFGSKKHSFMVNTRVSDMSKVKSCKM
eukprot:TRINITY_DN5299_c0_g1_i2.p1 TRINITY_DN5299_c0_g1~~TRINITY_DN5299_c0_g1_i2.p1  ORF type:complete len:352 (+),score=28.00 TRINITY_DN5299_c0_g1_i2:62-1117(+)